MVLGSAYYTIYANGQTGDEQVATVRSILSNNVPYGWLMCDATVRNKADYPKLWDEIPTRFKNTANNTFIIDLREATLKGIGLTSKSSAHYNSTGLTLGQFIEDRLQGHSHFLYNSDNNCYAKFWGNGGVNDGRNQFQFDEWNPSNVFAKGYANDGFGAVRYGFTTEVKSVGVNWIIKAM